MKPRWCSLIFLNFFAVLFRILLLGSGKNSSERENFSLLFGLSRPISARNEARMIFFFKKFFLLFFSEFSHSGLVKTALNEEKKFALFRPFPTCYGLKCCQDYVFCFFEFFWEFSSLGRVKTVLNEKFFSLFFILNWLVSTWNEATMMFFHFSIFFAIYFSIL